MKRLLAIKLTNHLRKWADSRGLTIDNRTLTNMYSHGQDKATHCYGTLVLQPIGIVLRFDTHYYWAESKLAVKGWVLNSGAFEVDEHYTTLPKLNELLDDLILQLEAKKTVTNDGLANLKLTGLPDLAHNPILAAYLCDVANRSNDSWSWYRSKISAYLRVQDVDTTMFPDYDYAVNNPVGRQLYRLLHNDMCGDTQLGHTYYHALITYHQPLPSETVSGCITYYQDDRKRRAGIRTPIKVRKYLDKFFREAFEADKLCCNKAYIINEATAILTKTLDLDVRIYDDSNLDGWAEAYASTNISSCMNTTSKSYGVGEHETFRCYLTSHFTDGRFSSGLSLAVLYNNDEPVARSIVYEEDGQKYYVRNYADDRLVAWFDLNGYEHSGHIPQGTHLWTELLDGYGYICPYVDGDSDEGDPDARFECIDGHNLWIIDPRGSYTLQTTSGYREVDEANASRCQCCGDGYIEYHDVPDYDTGGHISLCEDCYDDRVHYIDREWQYCRFIYGDSSLVRDGDGDWYSREYLADNDLVLCDDYLRPSDEVFYCSYLDDTVLKSDGVFLSDEPYFVQNSWADYSDCGYVSEDVYDNYGIELDYYVVTKVHSAHVSRVALDGSSTNLADEHIERIVTTTPDGFVVVPHISLATYDEELYNALVAQAEKFTSPVA